MKSKKWQDCFWCGGRLVMKPGLVWVCEECKSPAWTLEEAVAWKNGRKPSKANGERKVRS